MFANALRRGLRSSAPVLTRTAIPQTVARTALPAAFAAPASKRTFMTVAKFSKDEVDLKLARFHDEMLGTNWGDYLELVQNVPFWEAELEQLLNVAKPYMQDSEMGPRLEYCLMAVDCMYACEDVRDHINEILELKTRNSGLMNMGIGADPPLDNFDEQAAACAAEYEELLKRYPEMKPKIEQCVGHGLAILRMKYKFDWKQKYRFFY